MLSEGTEKLSVSEAQQRQKTDTEALQKEAKEEAKASRIKAQAKKHKVTVKTIERTKRKRITTLHGLHLFGPLSPLILLLPPTYLPSSFRRRLEKTR